MKVPGDEVPRLPRRLMHSDCAARGAYRFTRAVWLDKDGLVRAVPRQGFVNPCRRVSSGRHGEPNPVQFTLTHYLDNIMRSFLAVSLVLCFAVFPASGAASHNPLVMAEIVAQHDAETALYGHSHDEVEEEAVHIFFNHAHNSADHDHNGSFLIPAAGRGFSLADRHAWTALHCYSHSGAGSGSGQAAARLTRRSFISRHT